MNISLWNKIVLGTKFLFGGFESAVDYLLGLLNDFLSKEGVAGRVQKVRDYAVAILGYMKKYEKYCPAIWVPHYEKIEGAVQELADVFEDGKVSSDEAEKAILAAKSAIEEWMK